MSKQKKVIVQTKQSDLQPTESKFASVNTTSGVAPKVENSSELVFGKKNYLWIIGGFATMVIGYFLMTGGHMPSKDVWDESLIYSFRRITLAPFLILLGIVFQVIGIFTKK